jgi:hypothetical protein
MKAKTSLTLSDDFVEQRARQKCLAQEVAAINEHADKLNGEMSDALSFQAGMD